MPQLTLLAALRLRQLKQPVLSTEISICSLVSPALHRPHPNLPQWSATTGQTAALPGVEWSGLTSKATPCGQVAPQPTVLGISNSLTLASPLLVWLVVYTVPTTTGRTSLDQSPTPTEAPCHFGMLTTTASGLSQISPRSAVGLSHGASSTSVTPLCAVWTLMSTSFLVNELSNPMKKFTL